MSKLFAAIFLAVLLVCPSSSLVLYSGDDPSQIALTFDDGPSPGFTDKVLQILKKEHVNATFFVIGKKIEKAPYLLSQIASDGNEIGNHTYSHSPITWINNAKLSEEIEFTSDLIKKYTGQKTRFFRPPHGILTREKIKIVEKEGYKVALWHVHADDFTHSDWGMRSSHSIVKRVLSLVRGGDIILMHDESKQLVDALPEIIESLKKRGYHFVTLSKLTVNQKVSVLK